MKASQSSQQRSPCDLARNIPVVCIVALAALAAMQQSSGAEGPSESPGAFRNVQMDDGVRLLDFVGPGAVADGGLLGLDDSQRTILALRVVPDGMRIIREVADKCNVTALICSGVAMSDEDIGLIVENCPNLRSVAIQHVSTIKTDELSDLPADALDRLRQARVTGAGLAGLVSLRELAWLSIDGCNIASTDCVHLERAHGLKRLRLRNTPIGDSAIKSLATLEHLELLDLSGTEISGGLSRLVVCRKLGQLHLANTPFSAELGDRLKELADARVRTVVVDNLTDEVRDRAASTAPFTEFANEEIGNGVPVPAWITNAQEVRLYRRAFEFFGMHFGDCGSIRLSYPGTQRGVRVVSLDNCKETIGPAARYLADLQSLEDIRLRGAPLGRDECKWLTELPRLESLDVSGAPVDEECIEVLANCRGLRQLGLAGTRANDRAMAHLTRLRGLEVLLLGDTPVTDEGVAALEPLSRIRTLELRNCRIGTKAAEVLVRMKALERVDLTGTMLSAEEVGRLRGQRPNVEWRCDSSE